MDTYFKTNHYKLLEIMYDNTVTLKNQSFCPLKQEEIADEMGLSRAAVNKLFTELREKDYLIMLSRGKWQLTNIAVKLIEETKNL